MGSDFENSDDRPPHPFDYISPDAIQDLWGIGYTVVRRPTGVDPFNVPKEMVPPGRSYQWWHLVHDRFHFHREGGDSSGWAPVPASRHDGYFMPFGTAGAIEVGGLGLFEKPKFEVDQERGKNVAKAHKQVEGWADRYKEFTGGARITELYDDGARVTTVMPSEKEVFKTEITDHVETFERPQTKTVEIITKIPQDLVPYIDRIFAERDRIRDQVVMPDRTLVPGEIAHKFYAAIDADKGAPWWPTLHAIILPYAIEAVRQQIKETAS